VQSPEAKKKDNVTQQSTTVPSCQKKSKRREERSLNCRKSLNPTQNQQVDLESCEKKKINVKVFKSMMDLQQS